MLIGLNCWWRPTSSKRLRPCHASKWDFGVSTGAPPYVPDQEGYTVATAYDKARLFNLAQAQPIFCGAAPTSPAGTFRDAEAPLHGVSDYRVNDMWLFQ